MDIIAVIAIAAPLLGAALCLLGPSRLVGWAPASILGSGVALAVGLIAGTAPSGALAVDRLGGSLGLVAVVVGTCALSYAARQLGRSRRARRILAASLAVVACTIATDLAQSPLALVASWAATSAATLGLLAIAWPTSSRRRIEGAALELGLGDAALAVGLVAAALFPSGLDLLEPISGQRAGAAAGLLLAGAMLAAAARAGMASAARRGSSWVTDTVAAPTPISALLHAGVVNAGALLLLRLAPAAAPGAWLAALLAAACVATLVLQAPRISARIDLKGQLAASTVSQMAFMLLAVALGWPLLALTHLVGHSCYKAARFMGSGGATERRADLRRRAERGRQLSTSARAALAGAVAVAGLVAGWLAGPDLLAASAVLAPAAAVVLWTRSARPMVAPAASLGALVAMLAAYGALLALLEAWVAPVLAAPAWQAPWWGLGAAVGLVALLARRRQPSTIAAPSAIGITASPAEEREEVAA